MKIRKLPRKVFWPLVVLLHMLWVAMWCILCYVPTIPQQAGGVCRVECDVRLCVTSEEGDTLYLPRLLPDTLSPELCLPVDSFVHCMADAFFFDYDGQLLASASSFPHLSVPHEEDSVRHALEAWQTHLRRVGNSLRHQVSEMNYYSRTHTVDDDGYIPAMEYYTYVERESGRADSLLRRVEILLTARKLQIEEQSRWSVYVPHVQSPDSVRLSIYDVQPVVNVHDDWVVIRLKDGRLPKDAHAFVPSTRVFHFWKLDEQLRVFTLSPFQGQSVSEDSICPQVLPACWRQDLTGVADGAPIVNALGQLVGVSKGHRMVSVDRLRHVLRQGSYSWNVRQITRHLWNVASLPFTTDQPRESRVVAHPYEWNVTNPWRIGTQYSKRYLSDGRKYFGETLDGQPHGWGVMLYADSIYHVGHWKTGQRDGRGTFFLTVAGATSRYSGIWESGLLPYGVMSTPDDYYVGGFDASGLPNGSGVMTRHGGTEHYQGEYLQYQHHGLGLYIDDNTTCQIGAWNKDNFRGEWMLNAGHRVYGIDISRYQHEVGRQVYPIEWDKLRITRLDRKSRRRVKGEESYPVDFVFIKSTQGTKTVSRYYKGDVEAARRRNIPVGAYHFFSPMSGKEQAEHFLRHTPRVAGDLPPVLDLELTDDQIKRMGGAKRMFAEVETWIDIVHRNTGLRPILYVSQNYTNRYMPDAPASLRECDVWIARYSQYKPYVHTLIWQLSAWGKVEGIHGDVDINVWNGSRTQFQEYVRSLKTSN